MLDNYMNSSSSLAGNLRGSILPQVLQKATSMHSIIFHIQKWSMSLILCHLARPVFSTSFILTISHFSTSMHLRPKAVTIVVVCHAQTMRDPCTERGYIHTRTQSCTHDAYTVSHTCCWKIILGECGKLSYK